MSNIEGEKIRSLAEKNEVQVVLDKKSYLGKVYYKIKKDNLDEPHWELADNLTSMHGSIVEFERAVRRGDIFLGNCNDNEWEVELIKDRRIHNDRVQYLLQWKGWPGADSWEYADDCNCHNLIAAYENPKLKKLWEFSGSITGLWLDQDQMLDYMIKHLKQNEIRDVTLLKFKPNFPIKEKPLPLRDGINIGPLLYESHWYLVIFIINYINVTKRVLVGDSLNTLIGTQIKYHPVVKRLSKVYKNYPIKPIKMTQMERSDVCAYFTLAAFERAIALINENAQFIVENLFFDISRTELIRSYVKPNTDALISIALPIPDWNNQGPTCEFCENSYPSKARLGKHINKRHMGRGKIISHIRTESETETETDKSCDKTDRKVAATGPQSTSW